MQRTDQHRRSHTGTLPVPRPYCLPSRVPLVEQHPSPSERLECNPQRHFFSHPSRSTNSHPKSVTSNCPKCGLHCCQGIISTTMSAYLTLPWSNSLFRAWLPGWSLQHGNPAFSLSGAKLFNFHIILFFPNFYPPTEVSWANNDCVWNTFSSSGEIWVLFLFIFLLVYNQHITLCRFKVYNILNLYIYMLQHDSHHSFS